MKRFLKFIYPFFEKLISRPNIAGLHISDSGLFYAKIKNGDAETFSLRFPPEVLREGRIEDESSFVNLLKGFHEQILPGKSNEVIKAIVALPAEIVYTQSFTVPNIGKEKLPESLDLNLRSLSPIKPEEAYIGSEILEEAPNYYEVLGAFVLRKQVDKLKNLLEMARFYPLLFEFPALALSRIMSDAIGRTEKPFLVLHITSDGIELSIYKNSSLRFSYFRSWKSIQGDEREISKPRFEGILLEEVQKVVNFCLTKFQAAPEKLFLVIGGTEFDLKTLLEGRFGFEVVMFKTEQFRVQPAWYVSIGSAIRGRMDRMKDGMLELGDQNSFDLFYEEQLTRFIKLWRNILVGVTGFFFLISIAAAGFLKNNQNILESRLFALKEPQIVRDLTLLEEKAKQFNALIGEVRVVRENEKPWHEFLSHLVELAEKNRVVLDSFRLEDFRAPIHLIGHAPDNNTLIQFKNVLAKDPAFKNVDLPLSKINTREDGSSGFEIVFEIKI